MTDYWNPKQAMIIQWRRHIFSQKEYWWPSVANACMWLEHGPSHFKPIVERKFLDDIFVLFRSKDHVEKYGNYLNKQHQNINFIWSVQENGSLYFFDMKISRDNNKFLTSVSRTSHLAVFSQISKALYQACTYLS